MPYNGFLYSDKFDACVPYVEGFQFRMHSPAESLETTEMEVLLSKRGGIPTPKLHPKMTVLIHRLYQHILNYIPGLTDYKRMDGKILLFGSNLDYETVGESIRPTFGVGINEIFPNGGRICFTVDHLVENPQHIKSILAYTVSAKLPTFILEIAAVMESRSTKCNGR
jgi:hypothetical protein